MPNNGEPVTPAAATDANATASQPAQEPVSANPAVEVPTEVKSYLKGLGLDNAQVTPEFLKLAEAGMKQKTSVSKLSLDKEQLAKMSEQMSDEDLPFVQLIMGTNGIYLNAIM